MNADTSTIVTKTDISGHLLPEPVMAWFLTCEPAFGEYDVLVSLAVRPHGDGFEVVDFRDGSEMHFATAEYMDAIQHFHSLCG